MSAAEHNDKASGTPEPTYRLHGNWEHAWKVAALFAVIGAVGLAVGAGGDERRFAFSYLFAFILFLTLGLGGLFFVLVQHLTVAAWSVTVRRTAEFYASALPVFAVLFLPLIPFFGELFPWMEHHGAEHGEVAAAPEHEEAPPAGDHAEEPGGTAAPAHGPHQEAAHHTIMEKKAWYLNTPFFAGRAVFYFIAWTILALLFFRASTQQDSSKDPQWTVRMQRWAPVATIVWGLTLTFAMFDWVMSLEPAWYSTIFGVYIFAGSTVAIFALVILTTLGLKSTGQVGDTITVEHFHDLGKMMFGFIVFHAYVGFSQMMLQWYASIPEEVTFYHHRWHAGGWKGVSMLIVLAHFAGPFIFLMSRHIKRRLHLLGFGAAWMLVMHLVDIYWFVMPNFAPGQFVAHWMDLAAVFAVGGVYFAVVFWRMRRHSLIPVGDPRLARALAFQNA